MIDICGFPSGRGCLGGSGACGLGGLDRLAEHWIVFLLLKGDRGDGQPV